MASKHQELLQEFEKAAASVATSEQLMQTICKRLHEVLTRYNWVGFYMVDPEDPNYLNIGPFTGSFTPHHRIPTSRGLCGAAITGARTIVVNNVAEDPRYLAGSEMVKSEIVAPIFARRKVIGEIDVNSYFAGTFTDPEREFVEACGAVVGRYFEKRS